MRVGQLEAEQRELQRELDRWHREIRDLSRKLRPGEENGAFMGRLAELHEHIANVEGRVRQLREQTRAVHSQRLDEDEAMLAMSVFDPMWEALTPREQARVTALLVERVDYDGAKEKVAIVFRPAGIISSDETSLQMSAYLR